MKWVHLPVESESGHPSRLGRAREEQIAHPAPRLPVESRLTTRHERLLWAGVAPYRRCGGPHTAKFRMLPAIYWRKRGLQAALVLLEVVIE